MGSIVGEQNNLLKLLSFKHFPVTSSFALAIAEVQVRNIIPASAQREWYKKIPFKEEVRESVMEELRAAECA